MGMFMWMNDGNVMRIQMDTLYVRQNELLMLIGCELNDVHVN